MQIAVVLDLDDRSLGFVGKYSSDDSPCDGAGAISSTTPCVDCLDILWGRASDFRIDNISTCCLHLLCQDVDIRTLVAVKFRDLGEVEQVLGMELYIGKQVPGRW